MPLYIYTSHRSHTMVYTGHRVPRYLPHPPLSQSVLQWITCTPVSTLSIALTLCFTQDNVHPSIYPTHILSQSVLHKITCTPVLTPATFSHTVLHRITCTPVSTPPSFSHSVLHRVTCTPVSIPPSFSRSVLHRITWTPVPTTTTFSHSVLHRIPWLWRQATGLYPSIYLSDPNATTAHKKSRVSRGVAEALRIQNTFSTPNTAIYPFSNIQQGPYVFFQEVGADSSPSLSSHLLLVT